jgi:multicomponent Na+:H+ antiporter subunit D
VIEANLPAMFVVSYISVSLLIVLAGVRFKESAQPLATLGAGLAAVLSVVGWIVVQANTEAGLPAIRYGFGGWAPPIGIEFVLDGLSAFFLMVVNGVAAVVLWHSAGNLDKHLDAHPPTFYALASLFLLGLNGMILTGDLFNLYVFLEISSLSSYALIAIGSRQAPLAAFRYLILGTVGGTLYLIGVGFMYAMTGTLNMIDLMGIIPMIAEEPAVLVALLLMIVGIGVKAALFPLYGWLPESYTQTNSISSALIAPIGTKVAAYVMIRVLLFVFGASGLNAVLPLSEVIAYLAGAGILFGSIMAILQKNLKRMLAFSSVSQIGYILMGVALMNPIAFAGALFHVLNHAIMKATLFMVSSHLERQEESVDIRDFNDSYRVKYPWTMATFTLASISMIGLPPLAGFFSKWMLALGTIEADHWVLFGVILSSSLLNAVYFFGILEKVYLRRSGQKEASQASMNEVSWGMRLPALILALALLGFGFFNVPLLDILQTLFPA